jgi:hypothetical protein
VSDDVVARHEPVGVVAGVVAVTGAFYAGAAAVTWVVARARRRYPYSKVLFHLHDRRDATERVDRPRVAAGGEPPDERREEQRGERVRRQGHDREHQRARRLLVGRERDGHTEDPGTERRADVGDDQASDRGDAQQAAVLALLANGSVRAVGSITEPRHDPLEQAPAPRTNDRRPITAADRWLPPCALDRSSP